MTCPNTTEATPGRPCRWATSRRPSRRPARRPLPRQTPRRPQPTSEQSPSRRVHRHRLRGRLRVGRAGPPAARRGADRGLAGRAGGGDVRPGAADHARGLQARQGPDRPTRQGPRGDLPFPKKRVRSAVMVVPVAAAGEVRDARRRRRSNCGSRCSATRSTPRRSRSAAVPPTRVVKARLDGITPLVIGPWPGVAGLPKKARKMTGVILQIRTQGKGPDGGSLKVYGLDGTAPGTRSAPIVAGKATRASSWPSWAPTASWCSRRPSGQGEGHDRRLDPPLTDPPLDGRIGPAELTPSWVNSGGVGRAA